MSFKGLVLSASERYVGLDVSRDDLIQEANLSIVRSLGRYDPERGSISNFVVKVSRDAMQDAIPNEWPIPMKKHAWRTRKGLYEEADISTQVNKQIPTFKEMAVDQYRPEIIENMLITTQDPDSLNQLAYPEEGDSDELIDTLTTDTTTTTIRVTEEEVIHKCEEEALTDLVLQCCTEKQVEAIALFVQGYEPNEISEILTERSGEPISRQAIDNRLYYGFKKLREHASELAGEV